MRARSPLARTSGVREVSTTRDGDRIAIADGSLMFPEVLRPAPGEGIRTLVAFFCLQRKNSLFSSDQLT